MALVCGSYFKRDRIGDESILLHKRPRTANSDVLPPSSFLVACLSSDNMLKVINVIVEKDEPVLLAEHKLFSVESAGIVGVDSKVYIFGGDLEDPQATYVSDLSKKGGLTKLGSSHSPKRYPIVACGRGKIFALSVDYEIAHPFEMFDLDTGLWTPLPYPPFFCTDPSDPRFGRHVFIDANFFMGDNLYFRPIGEPLFSFSLTKFRWITHERDYSTVPATVHELCTNKFYGGAELAPGKIILLKIISSSCYVCVYDFENPEEATSKPESYIAYLCKIGRCIPHVIQGLDGVLGKLPIYSDRTKNYSPPRERIFYIDDKEVGFTLAYVDMNNDLERTLMCNFVLVEGVDDSGARILKAENVRSKMFSWSEESGMFLHASRV